MARRLIGGASNTKRRRKYAATRRPFYQDRMGGGVAISKIDRYPKSQTRKTRCESEWVFCRLSEIVALKNGTDQTSRDSEFEPNLRSPYKRRTNFYSSCRLHRAVCKDPTRRQLGLPFLNHYTEVAIGRHPTGPISRPRINVIRRGGYYEFRAREIAVSTSRNVNLIQKNHMEIAQALGTSPDNGDG